jgi:class 3 adenylate cyclase
VGTEHSTFLFADMAGFTALTEAHGDESAADAAADFCRSVRELVVDDAEVIKTIGDAVMCRATDAAAAVDAALRITQRFCDAHGALPVRVGMHTGPAIERDGDWFGATVNIAARVAALAAGDEVLLTEATASAAPDLAGVELHRHGVHELRNVKEPITLLRAVATGTATAPVDLDPVCRMVVDPGRAAGLLEYGGRTYRFCSLACAASFASEPDRYARPSS